MATYVYKDDDDNSGEAFLAIVILTIVAVIVYFFAAFLAVGVTYGTITSVANYIKAMWNHPIRIGRAIGFAWNANVHSMEYFFDRAQNHKDSRLIKLFMAMSGMGVAVVGTIILIAFIPIHVVFWTITLPFHKRFSADYTVINNASHVDDTLCGKEDTPLLTQRKGDAIIREKEFETVYRNTNVKCK